MPTGLYAMAYPRLIFHSETEFAYLEHTGYNKYCMIDQKKNYKLCAGQF